MKFIKRLNQSDVRAQHELISQKCLWKFSNRKKHKSEGRLKANNICNTLF